jgi:hypothetical protein
MDAEGRHFGGHAYSADGVTWGYSNNAYLSGQWARPNLQEDIQKQRADDGSNGHVTQ